ncbi:MAG: response regulator transcription factor [Polyangiaceae bacterium]
MIRVFLADDHEVVRHGLKRIIDAETDMRVVGEVADGRALVRRAEEEGEGWDVLILDVSLPRVSGLEALRRVRASRPELAIVVLSMYGEEQYGVQVLRAGAAAYLSKDRSGEELLAAIRKAARGGKYVTDVVADQLLSKGGERPPHERLTAREYQVFTLVVHGRTVTEIAAELDLTPGTISGHLMKVKETLSASSIADIVSYAHRANLIA